MPKQINNILMIGPSKDVRGGISTVINSYIHSEIANKYNVILLSSNVDGSRFTKLFQFLKSIFNFLWIMILKDIKIVHVHTASRASFYRKSIFVIFSKIFRKKVILHIHGGEFSIFYHEESGLVKQYYIKRMLYLSDRIIALSKGWEKKLKNILGESGLITIISNAISMPEHINVNKTDGNLLITVLFMGRLNRRKGVYDLIETLNLIVRKMRNVRFILAGDGDIDKVKQIVSGKGLSPYVVVPGWISNKEQYYKGADIYVLPSYNEGLPMSILEACSYSLPVITTPVGGITEVIEDGVNGFLVQPGDIKILEEKLLFLIRSGELREQMGKAGYEKVKDKFNIDHVVEQIDALYKELLA